MSHSNKVVCIMNESNFKGNNRRSACSIHVDCGRVLGKDDNYFNVVDANDVATLNITNAFFAQVWGAEGGPL